jgi:outer membrane protein assembly factor BamE (lipoprotein component of BamABCDE complex)
MAMKKINTLLAILLLIPACTSRIDNRGYEHEGVDYSKIQIGVHTTDQVLEILGSPSSVSAFPPPTWYYISKVTSTRAFLTPQVLEQRAVAIKFNESGIVESITETHGEDVREIKPIKRETPASGYESNMLRDMFSNFGKLTTKKPQQQQ